jgi:arylsulfatase A-like enzyme
LNRHRSALLTGRYPWKSEGIRSNLPSQDIDGLNLGFTLLPQRLKEKGYATYHFGKWHLGFADYRFTPPARGFDTSCGFYTAAENHFEQSTSNKDCDNNGNNHTVYDCFKDGVVDPAALGIHNDFKFTSEAVKAIHQNAARPNAPPFFIYLAYNSPHVPLQAEEKYMDLYSNLNLTNPHQQTFYAMVSSVDEGLGEVMTALKETGQWENTLLVYQADNGSPEYGGSNYPFRGSKHSNWEGGIRVPAIVGGGLLPPAQRGRVLNGVGHIVDWYATILTLAGLDSADTGNPLSPSAIDSIDLWGWISGRVKSSPRTLTVFEHNTLPQGGLPAFGAMRSGQWKLLV